MCESALSEMNYNLWSWNKGGEGQEYWNVDNHIQSNKDVLHIEQWVCKDVEDHANRNYQVEMQGRLNNIRYYQVLKVRQANNYKNDYKRAFLQKINSGYMV